MKKAILILSIIILIFSSVIYFRFKEERNYESRGQKLIDKIEQFKNQIGHLPKDVSELGLGEKLNDGPYYERIDSLNYKVYFNIGFDNKKSYSSSSKIWVNEK